MGGWRDCLGQVRLPTSGQPLVAEHHCDATGRRVRAIITLHAPQGVTDTAFLHDGWNLVAGSELAAVYRYDPYGLLVSATGPEKDRFRHRFSTKPQDKERGLLHDGCGSLGTTIGKWFDRDPVGERGGLNLYGLGINSPIHGCDLQGADWHHLIKN